MTQTSASQPAPQPATPPRRIRREYQDSSENAPHLWGDGDTGCFLRLDTPQNTGLYVNWAGNCDSLALVMDEEDSGRNQGFWGVNLVAASLSLPDLPLLSALHLWFDRGGHLTHFQDVARLATEQQIDAVYAALTEFS